MLMYGITPQDPLDEGHIHIDTALIVGVQSLMVSITIMYPLIYFMR